MKYLEKEKSIVIDIPFNIDLSGYMLPKNYIHIKLQKSFVLAQTKKWIERRMALFMKYTCNSLLRQTSQEFLCLVRCTEATYETIQSLLNEYPTLPENIIFTYEAHAIIDSIMNNSKWLYHVVIDSDNMYASNFIERLLAFQFKEATQTILCQEGYLYDEQTGRVATIFHKSPSFYAVIYNKMRYEALFQKRLFEKHWDAIKYPYEVMTGKNYCICTHEQNVDNIFEKIKRGYDGQLVEGDEKIAFLKKWNIEGVDNE